ncbi:MAG TPA: palindromic element RPE1 domain-containing protein [Rickettsia endosymbiont of Sericostoma sp.]|nr:palindromic element RPE1 domain-containing protein [Rickettsia endosymbiont of Sericostoma sp.]
MVYEYRRQYLKAETRRPPPSNRPLAKLAYVEEFEGDASPRTAAYLNVREDSSTALTYKLPAEVELCKRSNGFVAQLVRAHA